MFEANMNERDVILIGLGEFGKKTVGLFNAFLEERRYQIDSQHLKKINVFSTDFPTAGAFNYTLLSEKIDILVKDSRAKKFNGKVSYIIVGDLYDTGTSTYAIDFAYLPWVLDKVGSLKKKDVVGFFTFADAYGATVKADGSAMASILNFFMRMDEIDRANRYVIPYKDPNGHDFGEISSPTGPFDRNYVIVTPGTQEEVDRDTSLVFAERIFYELFYLYPVYEKIEIDKHGERDRKAGKLFSCFSMIQISRLEDLLHFFLKYTHEDEISEYLLADTIKGTDLDYYRQGFFDLIDVPRGKEFPIERAVSLFIKEHKSELDSLLSVYQSKRNQDFSNYIEDCRKKIEEKLEDFAPKYTQFARVQLDNMLSVFEKGYGQLFKINRLTGNISTYILYVENLSERLSYWEESLGKILEDEKNISLESGYERAAEKIRKIQSSLIYKFPLFVPIRRKLIENLILSLPLEEYLRANIRKNLARSFLDQWQDRSSSSRNPVKDCEDLIDSLKRMRNLMLEKKTKIRQKIDFISNIPSYYYVISEKEQGDYTELLDHLRSEHFGTSRKTDLENQAKEFFKTWTDGKSRQEITISSEFIRYFDDFIENKTSVSGGILVRASDAEEFSRWAEDALNNMEARTEQLSHKSFKLDSQAIGEKRVLLTPVRAADLLSEKIREKKEEMQDTEEKKVPLEFTLGSVVCFQDKLWMMKEEFQKYESLQKYEKENPPNAEYSGGDSTTENGTKINLPQEKTEEVSISEEEMTIMDKSVRSLFLDFCEPWVRLAWYKGKFGEEKETLSEEEIRILSKSVDISDLLQSVEDKPLRDFAKELGCPLSPQKERQIEILVKFIKRLEK